MVPCFSLDGLETHPFFHRLRIHLDEGDLVEEVLGYMHHPAKEMVRRLRAKVEAATESGRLDIEEGAALVRAYVRGLDDYTYLSR